MRFPRLGATCLLVWLVSGALPSVTSAQAPPTTDAGWPQNVFFGEVPPGAHEAPVLVFVHGLNGIAPDWWATPNDMYPLAFNAGYRTAFVSLSRDGTRNNNAIIPNATALKEALFQVLIHYNAPDIYVVAHSKGGIDAQAAMLDPAFSFYVKAVFTIATPHQGSELADWVSTNMALGTGTLGMSALRTDRMTMFRSFADPIAALSGIPYYTLSATDFATPAHPMTSFTGPLVSALTGGAANDGVATVARTKLSPIYSYDLGDVASNHFAAAYGSLAFPRINAQIQALQSRKPFRRIATNGFSVDEYGNRLPGDRQNSFPWSTQWFKGQLYVGTGRAFMCVITATNDAAVGTKTYPPLTPDIECTPDPKDLPLAAEVWRYTPEQHLWERVYQSPFDLPIEFDEAGNPTRFTARDIAFRGMAVFKENGTGVERLYIGGISASSLFDKLPAYSDPSVRRFPAPRMLWTEDGNTWNAVPQTPGTFFGDLNVQTEAVNKRGFRSFVTLPDANGVNRLFVTVSDLRGVGRMIVSSNPSAGDDAWRQASPSAKDLPIFTIYPYRNHIYATVGDTGYPNGYAVFKTDAATPDPADPSRYLFTPVVLGDGFQLLRAAGAISMQEFKGALYIGTDRPTELIRINPDDSWDLIAGAPRLTSSGYKNPLSGMDKGFNSLFNGHFYSMAVYDGELYLGTWDWSQNLRGTPLDGIFNYQYGFDFFKSSDGVRWKVIDRKGLGDGLNSSIRNLESTPFGLFVAVTNPYFGLQMFLNSSVLDLNRDGDIDYLDVELLFAGSDQAASGPNDPRDLDRDGFISVADAIRLSTQCTHQDCARLPAATVGSPANLIAITPEVAPSNVVLAWSRTAGAIRYHIFRSDPASLDDIFPPTLSIPLPNGLTLTVQDIKNGALDAFCLEDQTESGICALVQAIRAGSTMSRGFHWIGSSVGDYYVDLTLRTPGQALYYVVAENASGRISKPSNVVAGPSQADTPTLARLGNEILRLRRELGLAATTELARQVAKAAAALSHRRLKEARAALSAIDRRLRASGDKAHAEARSAVLDLTISVDRYVMLAETGHATAEAVTAALLDRARPR